MHLVVYVKKEKMAQPVFRKAIWLSIFLKEGIGNPERSDTRIFKCSNRHVDRSCERFQTSVFMPSCRTEIDFQINVNTYSTKEREKNSINVLFIVKLSYEERCLN